MNDYHRLKTGNPILDFLRHVIIIKQEFPKIPGLLSTEGFFMEVSTMQFNNCDIVQPHGRIDSFTAPTLTNALSLILDRNQYNIILDLSEVSYVSSAGLRVLIDIQKKCKHEQKGEAVLVKLPQRVYETMELAGFICLFRIFDDLSTATEYFSK